MFSSALEEMKEMRGMTDAVASMRLNRQPKDGLTADELKTREAGLVGKEAAASYYLEGLSAEEALEREYAKLAPPNAVHVLNPAPTNPVGRIVVLQVPGGADKREDGHRPDTVPILNACIANGFAAVPRFYMDASAPAVAQECARADAVIVRVPTDKDVSGVTRDKMRDMLAKVNREHRTVILPRFTAVDAMIRKDALVRLSGGRAPLKSAPRGTAKYASITEFRRAFPASLAKAAEAAAAARREKHQEEDWEESDGQADYFGGRRVLKEDRDAERAGNGNGKGVWSVELLSRGKMNHLIRLQEEAALEAGQTYEYSIGTDSDGLGPLGAIMRDAAVAFGGGAGRVGVANWEVDEGISVDSRRVTVNSIVECRHALDNQARRFTLGHFMLMFEKYLSKGGSDHGGWGRQRYLIDQAYLPGLSKLGEVRVDYIFDTPLEVTVKKPAEGGMGSTILSGAEHTHCAANDPRFKPLMEGFARDDMPRLMTALGLPSGSPLPIFWSAEFIHTSTDDDGSNKDNDPAASPGDDHGYVLTGLSSAVSGNVIRGYDAMDPASMATLMGRALQRLVPIPYARAKARAELDAQRAAMEKMMEEQRKMLAEERRKMEEHREMMRALQMEMRSPVNSPARVK